MEVKFTKQAIKYLLKLQKKKAYKIRNVISRIANGDTQGLNIKHMAAVNAYRVRIGDYRAIYEIKNDELILIVIKIGSRGDIYK